MASVQEDKSQGLVSVHLCAKYRQQSTTLSPYYQCGKIKKVFLSKSTVQLPLDHAFILGNRTLDIYKPSTVK